MVRGGYSGSKKWLEVAILEVSHRPIQHFESDHHLLVFWRKSLGVGADLPSGLCNWRLGTKKLLSPSIQVLNRATPSVESRYPVGCPILTQS